MAAVTTDPDAARRLIAEAMKRSSIAWITVPDGGRPRPAWHLWHEGAAYVVTGGIEQPLPGLAHAEYASVTARSKEAGGRLVTWIAMVQRVVPSNGQWPDAVRELHAKRLNPPDGERALERWMRESTVLRLVPTGELTEVPGSMPDASGAAPPPPSPAITSGPPPFVLGRRARPPRPRP
jgi:hypothetical protein